MLHIVQQNCERDGKVVIVALKPEVNDINLLAYQLKQHVDDDKQNNYKHRVVSYKRAVKSFVGAEWEVFDILIGFRLT
jgi:hypothetical protein